MFVEATADFMTWTIIGTVMLDAGDRWILPTPKLQIIRSVSTASAIPSLDDLPAVLSDFLRKQSHPQREAHQARDVVHVQALH